MSDVFLDKYTGEEYNLRGKKWTIELYPSDKMVKGAVYLGESNQRDGYPRFRIFEKNDEFIFVDDHWMTVDGGRVTYISVLFSSIFSLKKNKLKTIESSDLIKALEDVGVKNE